MSSEGVPLPNEGAPSDEGASSESEEAAPPPNESSSMSPISRLTQTGQRERKLEQQPISSRTRNPRHMSPGSIHVTEEEAAQI